MPPKPYPPILNSPRDEPLICIQVNEAWVPFLWDAVRPFQYPEQWSGELEENRLARTYAKVLLDILSEALGCDDVSNCCYIVEKTTQIIHRVNPETGQLEVSADGGTTWLPDPESPVAQIVAQPPPVPVGVSANKCDAATNGKEHIEAIIQACHDHLGTAETVFDLAVGVMSAVLSLAVAYFSGGTLAAAAAALAQAIWGAAHAAFEYGISAFDANWTTDERDIILCALVCNIGDDGAFTLEQYNGFLSYWKSHAAINPAFWFVYNDLLAIGRTGLNNLCSYGTNADEDCGDCECGCSLDNWVVQVGVEDVDLRTDGEIVVDAVLTEGSYAIVVNSPAPGTDCCRMGFTKISGTDPITVGGIDCDLAQASENINFSYNGSQPVNYYLVSGNAPFRAKVRSSG